MNISHHCVILKLRLLTPTRVSGFAVCQVKTPLLQVGVQPLWVDRLLEDAYDSGNYAGYQSHNGCPELHVSSDRFTVFSLVLA